MITNLHADLIPALTEASEVYIAVALLKNYGLNLIERHVPSSCKRKYLLGIDLPTPPGILRLLLDYQDREDNIRTRICLSRIFHPKVYIIRYKGGELLAFIGSANATQGGLMTNIEMSVRIIDQDHCSQLLNWFDATFDAAFQYDRGYVDEYESIYRQNQYIAHTQKSNTDAITGRSESVPGQNLIVPSGQFFSQSDFDAFDSSTHFETASDYVDARGLVRQRFLELNDRIIELFREYGIDDLHAPDRRNNYTSQHFHSRGNNHIPKDAIWLNYGKSKDERLRYPESNFHRNLVNHARIQIILRNTDREAYIGIWLYVGKERSSFYDRKHLKNNLNNPVFVNRLYDYLLNLGGAYSIEIGRDHDLPVSEIASRGKGELVDFLLLDDHTNAFIIGRDYQPDDPDLSEDNIISTVLIEFSKLYKIYDLIRDRR